MLPTLAWNMMFQLNALAIIREKVKRCKQTLLFTVINSKVALNSNVCLHLFIFSLMTAALFSIFAFKTGKVVLFLNIQL